MERTFLRESQENQISWADLIFTKILPLLQVLSQTCSINEHNLWKKSAAEFDDRKSILFLRIKDRSHDSSAFHNHR